MRNELFGIVVLVGVAASFGCGAAEDVDMLQQSLDGTGGSIFVPGCGNAPNTGANTSCGGQGGLTAQFYRGALLQNGTVYDGVRDTTIDSTTGGPLGNHDYCSSKGGSFPRRCLVYWDLTSIPTNATVHWAGARFVAVDPSVATYNIYAMLRAWREAAANWGSTGLPGLLWEKPGADGEMDASAATFGNVFDKTAGGWTNTPIDTALVQGWVSNPASNFGIMVAKSSYDGLSLASSEAADPENRPNLFVNYTMP